MSMSPSVSADTILQVDHLTMRFGGLVAIGDVSFDAKRGDITALIGPNGAGKTTVFNCITGFYKPTEGMITLRSTDGTEYLLERLPGHDINKRAKVARTFQNIRLFSGMTVLENLLVAQHNKLMKASGYTILGLFGAPGYKAAKEESVELAKYWLERADLTHRADEPAGSLPYGDQRRLEIARAMCTGPELLCLDEPAAGLNPKESLALNGMLNDIKATGTSILLIEHDMSVVMQISDHVVVLEYGRKISDGDPTFVKSDPRVIAAYLGVEDEEVEEVLVQVGDEHVIEQLDAEPDPAHGPGASSSMMAGPISDTIGHSDPDGEVTKVSPAASRAAFVDLVQARKAQSTAKTTVAPKTRPAAKKPVASKAPAKAEAKRATTKASAASKVQAKPVAAAKAPAKAAPARSVQVKPAAAKPSSKPVAKVSAKPAAKPATPAAKTSAKTAAKPAAKAPAKAAAAKPAPTKASGASGSVPTRLKAARGGKADNLLLIKGIGPINQRKLNEHGIFHFDQIAAWKKADVAAAEAYLEFDGRIAREDWIGQAKTLAAQAKKTGGGSK